MRIIKAINRAGVVKYTWQADTLRWSELPEWLLESIKEELPDYKIQVLE